MSLDWSILHWIQNMLVCPALNFLMPKITLLGNGGMIWLLASGDLHEKISETGHPPAMRSGCRRIGGKCFSEEFCRPPAPLLAGQQRPASDRQSHGLFISLGTHAVLRHRRDDLDEDRPPFRLCSHPVGSADCLFPAVSLCSFSQRCAGGGRAGRFDRQSER